MGGYSVYQQATLALLPKITGSLGFLGSIFVASEVLRDHRNGKGNPVKRAILAICLYEIPHSIGHFLSSWAVPSNFAFAVGTKGTCNIQGFFLQIVIGAPLSTMLLIYFFSVVIISGTDSEKTIRNLQALEWKAHSFIALISFFSAFLLLWKEQYNPMNNICWVNGYPAGCGNSVFGGGEGECERGDYAYLFGLVFFYAELWFTQLCQIIFHITMRQHALKDKSADIDWATRQALLYSLGFLLTWTPSTMWSVFMWTGGGGFWLDVLLLLTEPLQGFWNFLIFIRNRPESMERLENILLWECCYPQDEDERVVQRYHKKKYSKRNQRESFQRDF